MSMDWNVKGTEEEMSNSNMCCELTSNYEDRGTTTKDIAKRRKTRREHGYNEGNNQVVDFGNS